MCVPEFLISYQDRMAYIRKKIESNVLGGDYRIKQVENIIEAEFSEVTEQKQIECETKPDPN